MLSVDVTMAEDGSYDRAMDRAGELGVQEVGLTFPWSTVETAPLTFDTTNLDIARVYYPARRIPLNITVAPISTNQNLVPADLRALPLDDAQVITRFNAFVDVVLDRTRDVQLTTLIVGSEFDVWLGHDPGGWTRYLSFFRQVARHARERRPGLEVTAEVTFTGHMDPALRAPLDELADEAGVVAVSYYPLSTDFTVLPPQQVHDDFARLARRYPSRRIKFFQLGFPSSTTCGSSEALQSLFYAEVFRAWDAHADQVKLVDVTWLHDLSEDAVRGYGQAYGLTEPRFLAYLASLGLVPFQRQGTPKPAFFTVRDEARLRGW